MQSDNNKMAQTMAISFFLKTLKIVIVIVNFSYFIGMGWLILCQIGHHVASTEAEEAGEPFDIEGHFISNFGIHQPPMTPAEQTIVATYFAFTSLSTVGFGDYHPRSDLERVVGAIMLCFGVAIFGFAMG